MDEATERKIRQWLNPADDEFSSACEVVGRYVDQPTTGWDAEQYDRVQKILNDWQMRLFANAQHAAHDREKS